jgi:hypothetical protein
MEENDKLYYVLQLAKPKKEKAVQKVINQLKLQAKSKHLKALKSLKQECQQQKNKRLY